MIKNLKSDDNFLRKENHSVTSSLAEKEIYSLVTEIKADVEKFSKLKEAAKKIPSPASSLIRVSRKHVNTYENQALKNKTYMKQNRTARNKDRSKSRDTESDNSQSSNVKEIESFLAKKRKSPTFDYNQVTLNRRARSRTPQNNNSAGYSKSGRSRSTTPKNDFSSKKEKRSQNTTKTEGKSKGRWNFIPLFQKKKENVKKKDRSSDRSSNADNGPSKNQGKNRKQVGNNSMKTANNTFLMSKKFKNERINECKPNTTTNNENKQVKRKSNCSAERKHQISGRNDSISEKKVENSLKSNKNLKFCNLLKTVITQGYKSNNPVFNQDINKELNEEDKSNVIIEYPTPKNILGIAESESYCKCTPSKDKIDNCNSEYDLSEESDTQKVIIITFNQNHPEEKLHIETKLSTQCMNNIDCKKSFGILTEEFAENVKAEFQEEKLLKTENKHEEKKIDENSKNRNSKKQSQNSKNYNIDKSYKIRITPDKKTIENNQIKNKNELTKTKSPNASPKNSTPKICPKASPTSTNTENVITVIQENVEIKEICKTVFPKITESSNTEMNFTQNQQIDQIQQTKIIPTQKTHQVMRFKENFENNQNFNKRLQPLYRMVNVLKWNNKSNSHNSFTPLLTPMAPIKFPNKLKNPVDVTNPKKSQYHSMCCESPPPPNPNQTASRVPNSEELNKMKQQVDQAIAQKKIFTVSGAFPVIRRCLLKRGWVEKMRVSYRSSALIRKLNTASMVELLDYLKDKEKACISRRVIISRMLASHPVDFYWEFTNDLWKNSSLYANKFPIVNRLSASKFATKSGLCETAKRAYWYQIPDKCYLNHPRTYNFSCPGDPHDFLEDYKRTAAMSMLKWIVARSNDKIVRLISSGGKIPLSVFDFAIVECKRFIKTIKHKDIDLKFTEASDFEWHQFFEHFYSLVHLGEHFKKNDIETVESLILKSKVVLAKLAKIFSHLDMDDTMNIWILKPCNGCRGIGIHLCRTLEYILTIVKNNPQRKYVIQKYIEKPLLIFKTKFDIRQWFLISNTYPLTIWIYKDCYIRLSSQTFNIRTLHESIHLTNNSIQTRYRNANKDPSLPMCNMWFLKQFKKYLELIGHPDVFDKVIFPGMKANILCAILANRDHIVKKKNTFELYGSDFMITEDFKPWLLEINCKPALYASTPVTGQMCPKVLEDTLKIIIDYQRDRQPHRSNFELLYREKIEKLPNEAPDFHFSITELKSKYFIKPEDLHLSINNNKSKDDIDDTDLTSLSLKSEMKKTLGKLLTLIKTEKNKRYNMEIVNHKTEQAENGKKTVENALKDCTVIMNLDNNELSSAKSDDAFEHFQTGMLLNKVYSGSSDSEEEDSDRYSFESEKVTTSSNVAPLSNREQAKNLIVDFIGALESFQV